MVNIDLDVAAGGNRAPVTSLDEDTTADVSRYWRTVVGHEDFQQNRQGAGDGEAVARRPLFAPVAS